MGDGMNGLVQRRLPGGVLGSTLWLASLILGVSLVIGAVGGTGARAAHGSRVPHTAQVRQSQRAPLTAAQRRRLLQRLGVTIMYAQ
jgi:hypothetical protein